ncbi:MAG: hypothetical protein WC919_01135, partial [Candidatus Paceibacterota bacterium]
ETVRTNLGEELWMPMDLAAHSCFVRITRLWPRAWASAPGTLKGILHRLLTSDISIRVEPIRGDGAHRYIKTEVV